MCLGGGGERGSHLSMRGETRLANVYFKIANIRIRSYSSVTFPFAMC